MARRDPARGHRPIRALALSSALAFAALLLAPVASAVPGEGTVVADGGFLLEGNITTRLTKGGVAWMDPSAMTLEGIAEKVEMTLYSFVRVEVTNPFTGGFSYWREEPRQRAEIYDTMFSLESMRPNAKFGVGGRHLDVEIEMQRAVVRGYQYRFLVQAPFRSASVSSETMLVFRVDDAITADSDHARVRGTGPFTIYIWNATIIVDGKRYETGMSAGPTGELPIENVRETRYVWAVLRLDGANLTVAGDNAVVGGAQSYHVDGAVRAVRANVDFTMEGVRRTSVGTPFTLHGSVDLVPIRISSGSRDLGSGKAISSDPELGAAARGDIRELSAGAVRVHDPRTASANVAIGAAAVTVLGWAAYTRLRASGLLDRSSRATIFSLLEGSEGLSARQIERATGLGWSTVRYHLRQLERHGFVLRVSGRGYVVAGAPPAHALAPTTRNILLERIRQAEGSTQKQLVSATGVSQRAASYTLQKLGEEGRVSSRRTGRSVLYFLAPVVDTTPTSTALGTKP